ncbi:hypothetical protein HPB50_017689 [Hyalomma asiaticum]|uniref:Uncharacterized protein n=1 Tax=Hyalomma asiaticum TaxID=266040 RepID=A0ACB7SIZ6_HYAAI|nr:hypothetical protein HPB50_017689 [Hyalomma asiaticum]
MGGIFSTPPAQRCLMSTDSDSSGSSVQPVAMSTVVRTRHSDDSSDASSSSSICSNITLASSSVVSETSSVTSLASSTCSGFSSSGSSSSLSSDERVTRSPPPKTGDEATEGGEAGASGSRSDLERRLRDMEEELTCVICMCRRRDIAFLCGHAACSMCAAQIDTCHMCRRPIATKIRLH